MKRLLLTALALCLLWGSAGADIQTADRVNLRKGPGKEYAVMATVPPGTLLGDLDCVMNDGEGAAWYWVEYQGEACWVLAQLVRLTDGEYEAQPLHDDLACYAGVALDAVAQALGLAQHDLLTGAYSQRYYNHSLQILGNETLEAVALFSDGYTVFGAAVGMPWDEATNAAITNGLRVTWVSPEVILLAFEPTGSVTLSLGGDGLVSGIEWTILPTIR